MFINAYLKLKKTTPFLIPFLKAIHRILTITKHKIFLTDLRLINYLRSFLRIKFVRLFVPIKKDPMYSKACSGLNKNGLHTIKNLYSKEEIKIVLEKFKTLLKTEKEVRIYGNTESLLTDFDFQTKFPELLDLLKNKEAIKTVEQFYGCPMQLHYISCYKRLPYEDKENLPYDLQSANWHLDDNTPDTLHLVVYLHDVVKEHGPTIITDKKRTRDLYLKGFYSRNDYRIPESEMENDEHNLHLVGESGNAHFLLAPLVLHRAGQQRPGHERYSVIFSFRPGLEPGLVDELKSPLHKKIYKFLEWITEDFKHPGISFVKTKDNIYKR